MPSRASGREQGRRKISTATKQSRDLAISTFCVEQSWQESWKLPGGMNKGEGKKSHSRTV